MKMLINGSQVSKRFHVDLINGCVKNFPILLGAFCSIFLFSKLSIFNKISNSLSWFQEHRLFKQSNQALSSTVHFNKALTKRKGLMMNFLC